MLSSSKEAAQATVNTMMYGNLAINLAMSASLQMLWGMVNVMQLIVKMPLFNITFPQNAAKFYTFIASVANFDLLPTDEINDYMFNFTKQNENDMNFETMGYETDDIFDNLGSMLFYVFGFFGLVAFALVLKFFKNKYKT